MSNEIKVITGQAFGEITEKKSRFIAGIYEVHSEAEAAEILDAVRKKYWDAKHNCYAFVTGPNNECSRCSDDREPSGTAGKPILEVLTGGGWHDTLIVVTRYFGGILLGTGGLVRAYQGAALEAIAAAEREGLAKIRKFGIKVQVISGYALAEKAKSAALGAGAVLMDTEYAEKVTFAFFVPEGCFEDFGKKITEATNAASVMCAGEPASYLV